MAVQRIPIRSSYKMPDVGQTGLPEVRETQLWGNEKWGSVSGTTPHRYDSPKEPDAASRSYLLA